MSVPDKQRLFVIDGHALCYRAYFAFVKNPLVNSKGQNTSAIFGFTRMLLKLCNDQKPDYLIVAFDPPKKSFRFRLYEDYKANREKMPDDLRPQIEEIKHMLDVLGITKLEEEDFEADDVLGTLANKYGTENMEVVLVTGDKDAYQLVNENVKIYANKKGITEFELYDREGVQKKLGLAPDQVIDYMALMGDSSDNIPGVQGVGEKTAQKLIAEHKTLDLLYEHLDNIKGKLKDTLAQNRDMAYLSRELVTIRTDLDINVKLESSLLPDLKRPEVKEYFQNLEMESIARELFPDNEEKEIASIKEKKDYRTVFTATELQSIAQRIKKYEVLSIDTETTSVNPVKAELAGISISLEEGSGWYIPVFHETFESEKLPDKKTSLEILRPVLEDEKIKKVGQNIKYDLIVLRNEGIELKGIYFDTMVASYLLNPADRRHNLDDMAQTYLNYKTISFKELTGTGKKSLRITEVPLNELAEYAIEDADITLRLYNILSGKISDAKTSKLFSEIEIPLISVLADMEQTGVSINLDYFKKLSKENQRLLDTVAGKIYELAGGAFNINSTRELAHVLFEKLGLKPVKKTKTGYSTDIQVLEALNGRHDIIEYLIKYRTFSKLKSTYIDTLPTLVNAKTGRIHTSYNQTVAATGRLSSSDPNLQNIPIRDDFGKKIREGFVPSEGRLLMSADYSQIELRLAAHISCDEAMTAAFKEGTDIHSLTASSVFGVDMEDLTPDMRRQAKIINFATIYGVSPYGLSQQADISVQEAARFINKYFETYPGFKDYIEKTIAFAREKGYVETLSGRRRPLPDINADNQFRREGAERIAINTPLQGTAADLIKIAMINIHREIQKKMLKGRMIIQVHDELVCEVPSEEKDEFAALVRSNMESALRLNVPLVVDIGWGNNWGEAH